MCADQCPREIIAKTFAHFDKIAEKYNEQTSSKFSGSSRDKLYEPLLTLLPLGSSILDAGCGTGIDSEQFIKKGYTVTAIDGSKEMYLRTHMRIGSNAKHLEFHEVNFHEEFDGIWACASLHHIPRACVYDVITRLSRALKPGGYFFAVVKHGTDDKWKGEEPFFCYTEYTFCELIEMCPALHLHRCWIPIGLYPDRHGDTWLWVLMRKTRCSLPQAHKQPQD